MNKQEKVVLELKDINMFFKKPGNQLSNKYVHVLKDINLKVYEKEIVALIGESGCGKTTLGKIITGLIKPTSGKIVFNKDDNSSTIQFIQQDSYAALNPVRTIYQSLYAPIKNKNKHLTKMEINLEIERLMKLIGLEPVEQYLTKYPHQLSGGQRQRILMARAISLNPKLIVADEPVSMIDVSLRLSILNLMKELNEKLNMSFVYISHDLSTTRYIAQNGRICVMYLGEIVELGQISEVISNPLHPYTRALIQAVPTPDPRFKGLGELPLKSMKLGSIEDRVDGCSFMDRCLYSCEKCQKKLNYIDILNHEVLCNNLENVPNTKIYNVND